MSRYFVFSITRDKQINMDIVDVQEEGIDDPFRAAISSGITPPYLGESMVVKETDVHRFKLKSTVVEV